ncbi:MAG: BON domain-containing protein [Steroidobacteraceae bacterium]
MASGRVLLLGLVGTFGWCAGAQAAEPVVGAGGFPLLSLKEIVVEASKVPETPADAELNKQVESAMEANRYFYNYHVSATTRNGVVVLRGLVFDDWDVRTAIRLSRRIAGVKRVINQLEIGAQP